MQRILSKLPRWELDHKDEDIRGWPLRDADGRMIGTVSDLIADTDTHCVTQVILANGKRISAHELWLGDHVVTLTSATREAGPEAKAKLPAVPAAAPARGAAPAEVTPLASRPKKVMPEKVMPAVIPVAQAQDVIIPLVDEELEVGKRNIEAGGVRVQTRTVTKEVRRDVPLREERVSVERRRVDQPLTAADADAQLCDRAFEIKATSELPVVTKRAHAVEEIVLKKERSERTE